MWPDIVLSLFFPAEHFVHLFYGIKLVLSTIIRKFSCEHPNPQILHRFAHPKRVRLRFIVEFYSLAKCVSVLQRWKIYRILKTTAILQSVLVMALQIIIIYNIYKYVFRAVGCFPGPYLAKRFYSSTHKLKSIVNNCSGGGTSSSTGMAAVVIAIEKMVEVR